MISTLDNINENDVPLFSLNGMRCKAKVIKVYDGDTVTCIFPFKGEYFKWKCRLIGIDTPELRTRNLKEKEHGYKARDYLRSQILKEIVDIECHDFDKYGRLLISIMKDNVDIVHSLIENGFGKAYDGGTKTKWEY